MMTFVGGEEGGRQESNQGPLLGCNRSGGVVLDDPDKIKSVHRAYFDAGADVAITASYQGSIEGYMNVGLGGGNISVERS